MLELVLLVLPLVASKSNSIYPILHLSTPVLSIVVSAADCFLFVLSVMKLQIRVGEDGVINEVKFKTFGCGSAIASSSYMTERVKGMTLDQAGAVKNTEIAKELCLPPVKCESSFLRSQYSIIPKMRFGRTCPVALLGMDWGHLFNCAIMFC